MGTILAQTILDSAATLLQDTGYARWLAPEMLGYLNEGQREAVLVKPSAYVVVGPLVTVAGTKQTLPDDAIALIDVTRNMGTDGATPGRVIRAIGRQLLDNINPAWHTATASATTKHFVHNALVPKVWYAYPPQPAAGRGQVEVAYSASPPDVAAVGDPITLDDAYAPALGYYVLYRAYNRDAEYAGNAQEAARYYSLFMGLLGAKKAGEAEANPAQATAPRDPMNPGSDK